MKAITITQHWVLDFVIGLNLCPFARKPFNKQQIRFTAIEETDPEEILLTFWDEVQFLIKVPQEEVSNTLLILPKVNWDFESFLDIYYVAEELLEEHGMHEHIQLAGFHPDFQFEETAFDEPVNFVNRSPMPMIHLLRVQEVAEAIDNHPDAEGIPERNKHTLDAIGYSELEKRFKMVYRETDN